MESYKNFAKFYDKFMRDCNYNDWVAIVKEEIKNAKIEGKKLLDLGCGTGETLLKLKDEFECSGLDLSKEMLSVANEKLKNKKIKLYQGDMREFSTGETYDIIISLFDTVNHLTTGEDLVDLMNSVYENLNSGGIYIFDTIDRKFMEEMFPGGIYYDNRDDMTIIWEHFQDEGIDILSAVYFVKNKLGTYDKYEEIYEKKIFPKALIKKVAEANEFEVINILKSDRVAGNRTFYVLKK